MEFILEKYQLKVWIYKLIIWKVLFTSPLAQYHSLPQQTHADDFHRVQYVVD